MKFFAALCLYAIALFFIYAGFSAPGAEQLSVGFPRNDSEIIAALLITVGMIVKLGGHVVLFESARG